MLLYARKSICRSDGQCYARAFSRRKVSQYRMSNSRVMGERQPSPTQTILHLPAGSVDWAGVLTQFTLLLAAREGRAYATWASERLLRFSRKGEGIVALSDGKLLGLLLLELQDHSIEFSFPWTCEPDVMLAGEIATTAIAVGRALYPEARYLRMERQLLPGQADPVGLETAGACCRWRNRMMLELANWHDSPHIAAGYRVVPWNIRDLEAAAAVVYRANINTLDAVLYAPFFGESPAQCRKGLLSILSGTYGPLHPQATICAFHDSTLVGINLVIHEGTGLASIVELSVDPAHQRQGLGRALMMRTLQILKADHIERVELAVTQENARAVNLYASLGFLEYGEFPVCVWPLERRD